jgi:hypothetical protein
MVKILSDFTGTAQQMAVQIVIPKRDENDAEYFFAMPHSLI